MPVRAMHVEVGGQITRYAQAHSPVGALDGRRIRELGTLAQRQIKASVVDLDSQQMEHSVRREGPIAHVGIERTAAVRYFDVAIVGTQAQVAFYMVHIDGAISTLQRKIAAQIREGHSPVAGVRVERKLRRHVDRYHQVSLVEAHMNSRPFLQQKVDLVAGLALFHPIVVGLLPVPFHADTDLTALSAGTDLEVAIGDFQSNARPGGGRIDLRPITLRQQRPAGQATNSKSKQKRTASHDCRYVPGRWPVPRKTRGLPYFARAKMPLLGHRLVLEQEKTAFAAHREVEISVAIKVRDADLDAAPCAAAVIDHMLGPIDRVG
jgi:hypothetical protein